jgi:oligopeptide transport system substrate-binding protein
VRLTSLQPWFPQQVAHHAFLAVHRPTVERYGQDWTDPEHMVTNGPFKVASWSHDSSVVVMKNQEWRGAENVALDRVTFSIVPDAAAQVRLFLRGDLDATDGNLPLPREDVARLTESGAIATYPIVGTRYYGFNVDNIPDVNQRRAMALALDRQAHAAATGALPTPATGFVPPGMPGFDTITDDFLSVEPDLVRARVYMSRAANPKTTVTLFLNDAPDVKRTESLARRAWAPLGVRTKVKVLPWAPFLETMGPPPDEAVDVVGIGWLGDYVDPYNFFDLLRCHSENNWFNFCERSYDRLLADSLRARTDGARYRIYHQLEEILTGRNGQMPVAPVFWFTVTPLEQRSISATFNLDPLYYFDLTKVETRIAG